MIAVNDGARHGRVLDASDVPVIAGSGIENIRHVVKKPCRAI